MKQKLLLTLFIASINLAVNAQKSATYAITGTQKGSNNWTEVRLVDVNSGQDLKTVFKNSEETQPLNARTGKPVKKSTNDNLQTAKFSPDGSTFTFHGDNIIIKDGNLVTGDNVRIIRTPKAHTAPENAATARTPGTVQASKLRQEAIEK
ncbi:MAG TPA: hypothetical protein VMY77_07800, partial [Chitinophagaceae bacterium]|nr:hypothetical protein [Chitinophagaceae bacterium]